MTAPARLRELLAAAEHPEGRIVAAPGCSDALGAVLIEQAGFPAAYMSGFASSATLLGRGDLGLLTGAEMVANARRIAAATTLPVIADADTGYGNPLNVARTVADFERAGVAAIHLEDQVAPKRCGHLADKAVVPTAEMVAKLRAAVDHRDELLIIARTDARDPEGLDAALARAEAYASAGADLLFVEALPSPDEVARVGAAGLGAPLVYNWVDGGRSPALHPSELHELGYAVVIYPVSTLFAATTAIRTRLAAIRDDGTPPVVGDPFGAFTDLIGLPEALDAQRRYES